MKLNLNAIVVDDEEFYIEHISRMIRPHFTKVESCSGIDQILSSSRNELAAPAVFLIDFDFDTYNVLDKIEDLREIKSNNHGVYFFLFSLTKVFDKDDKAKLDEIFDGYIFKMSFKVDDLLESLRDLDLS